MSRSIIVLITIIGFKKHPSGSVSTIFSRLTGRALHKNGVFLTYVKSAHPSSLEISFHAEPPLDTPALLSPLLSVQDTGSIAQAANPERLSYRDARGLLRQARVLFGARLSPMLEGLSSELEAELGKMVG